MMLTQGVSRLPRRVHRRVPALLDRRETCDTPITHLLVLVLVLGLLALIRICVTALRITLCVWGAATFIAFIFIENVIMRYSSSPGAGLAAAAARGPSGGG